MQKECKKKNEDNKSNQTKIFAGISMQLDEQK